MQMEVPSVKATISGFAGNSTRTLFADALKSDGNHKSTFYCPPRFCELVRAISFYDGTHIRRRNRQQEAANPSGAFACLNERSFSIIEAAI
jgi:hypothetical protein